MRIKNKKLRYFLNGLGLAFFVVFSILFVLSGKAYQQELDDNACYTIAVTDGFKYISKSGFGAYYIYIYDGKEYRDFGKVVAGETTYRGGRYLLKVNSKNPTEHTRIFCTIPIIGDSIPLEYRPLCSELEKDD